MTSEFTYELTAIEICERGLEMCRVIDPDTALEPRERQNAFKALNGLTKYLQTKGFNLWRKKVGFLPLNPGQFQYFLGMSQYNDGDRFLSSDNFTLAALAADMLSGADQLTYTVLSQPGLGTFDLIQGAQPIIDYDITETITGWITVEATISASAAGLNVVNNGAGTGAASFQFPTVVGREYVIDYTYIVDNDVAGNVTVGDIGGSILSQGHPLGGDYSIRFTARQLTSYLAFSNASAGGVFATQWNAVSILDTTTGFRIGIYKNDNTLFWTRILRLLPGNQLDLVEPIDGDADTGNLIYVYESDIPRPMDIIQINYSRGFGQADTPTTRWDRDRYLNQPIKSDQGTVTAWYYTPQLNQGQLFIWQAPDNNPAALIIDYIEPFYVTPENGDVPEFPSEWYDLLSLGVAYRLLTVYTVPPEVGQEIKEQFAMALDDALGFDNDSDMYIGIDYEGRYD